MRKDRPKGLQASLGRSPDDAGRDRAQARAHARPDGLLSPGGDLLAHNGVNQSLKEVRHDLTAHRADQLDDFGHALVPRLEVGDFLFAVCKVLRHGNADRGNSPWSTPRAIQSEIALKVKFEKKKGGVWERDFVHQSFSPTTETSVFQAVDGRGNPPAQTDEA